MGTVDKFGRTVFGGRLDRGSRPGPKGDGFLLDGDGNYLVSDKRIRQLHDPEDDSDAANKRWSQAQLQRMHEQWREAMNFGEVCMEKINEVNVDLLALDSRLEKLENQNDRTLTITDTNIEPSRNDVVGKTRARRGAAQTGATELSTSESPDPGTVRSVASRSRRDDPVRLGQ